MLHFLLRCVVNIQPAPYGASTCQPHLWHNDREVLVKQAQRAVA